MIPSIRFSAHTSFSLGNAKKNKIITEVIRREYQTSHSDRLQAHDEPNSLDTYIFTGPAGRLVGVIKRIIKFNRLKTPLEEQKLTQDDIDSALQQVIFNSKANAYALFNTGDPEKNKLIADILARAYKTAPDGIATAKDLNTGKIHIFTGSESKLAIGAERALRRREHGKLYDLIQAGKLTYDEVDNALNQLFSGLVGEQVRFLQEDRNTFEFFSDSPRHDAD